MKYDFDKIIERRDTDSVKWNPKSLKAQFGKEDLLPLWVADMDFYPPEEVLEAIHKRVDHGIFGYSFREASCDQAIIDWLKKRWHIDVKREWISVTSGAVQAITQLIQALTEEGDKILIQPPVYYPFKNAIIDNRRQVVYNPLKVEDDQVSMDYDQLEELLLKEKPKMMILSNPHNPLGRVWKEEELSKLANLLNRYGVFLVSDELHGDLVFNDHEHWSFFRVKEADFDALAVIASPSKTFNLAGLAFTTCLIPNKEIRDQFETQLNRSRIQANHSLTLAAVEAAYRHGEAWLDALLPYLYRNYEYLKEALETSLPQALVFPLEGTYLAWVNVKAYSEQKSLEELLVNRAGLALDDGVWFGEEGAYSVRFNLACPRTVLEEAVNRFIEAIKGDR